MLIVAHTIFSELYREAKRLFTRKTYWNEPLKKSEVKQCPDCKHKMQDYKHLLDENVTQKDGDLFQTFSSCITSQGTPSTVSNDGTAVRPL